jgi:hypothetical protein
MKTALVNTSSHEDAKAAKRNRKNLLRFHQTVAYWRYQVMQVTT